MTRGMYGPSSDADDFTAIPTSLPGYLMMVRYKLYVNSLYIYELKHSNLGAYSVNT